MRSLKRLLTPTPIGAIKRCDSEWPYEVTETSRPGNCTGWPSHVAIVNGRMRSLKQAEADVVERADEVAIVNGRMRSLKPLSELIALHIYTKVAIVNGRMRSLKLAAARTTASR